MKKSAGILMYRKPNIDLEVLLVHPGGPFWKNKNLGAWSIPKGEFLDDEDPLTAAKREFNEETGFEVSGKFAQMQPVKLKSGKLIYCWAHQGDLDASKITSNFFDIEWPPKSGKMLSVPEVDRAEWCSIPDAFKMLNEAQTDFLRQLTQMLTGE